MPTHANIPTARTNERRALIDLLHSQLEQDPRVRAAWLSGSISRGDDDWLSDIDIHVIATDESIENIVETRHSFVATAITPVLTMDMLKNAAPNGAYLLVHYPGEFGPQHVDWYWLPESGASRPGDGYMLFDRAALPGMDGEEWAKSVHQTENRPAINSTDPIDLVNHHFEFFWAMALIVSKYIVRGDHETVEYMLNMIVRTLGQIGEQLTISVPEIEPFKFDAESNRRLQFDSLRSVSKMATSIESDAVANGATIPSGAIELVEAFFDACELAAE